MKRVLHILLVVVLVLAFLPFFKIGHGKKSLGKDAASKEQVYPYRVINSLDSSDQLIGYELYENAPDGDTRSFSAIIKSMDPGKDDYKIYCRSIVADIVKMAGTNQVKITVYDDVESFEMSEVKLVHDSSAVDDAAQMEARNKKDYDPAGTHLIGAYSGRYTEDPNVSGQLVYYPNANNHYSESENYDPDESQLGE